MVFNARIAPPFSPARSRHAMRGEPMSLRTLVAAGVAFEAAFLLFWFLPPGPDEVLAVMGIHLATAVALYGILRLLRSSFSPITSSHLAVLIGFGMLFRVTLAVHPVVASDDIYRYLWDGRVASTGINPFLYAPADPRLAFLSADSLASRVNHPELGSLYPPLAQALFRGAAVATGGTVAGFKLLLCALELVSMLLLVALLRQFDLPRSHVVLYAWSPIPILQFGLDGHIDALGIPFLLLTLLFAARSRPVRSALALGFAGLAKLHPLVLAPLLVRLRAGWRGWVLALLPCIVLAAAYLPYLDAAEGMLASLGAFGGHWAFNASVFTLLYAATGSNPVAHAAAAVLTVLWIGWCAAQRAPFTERVVAALLGFTLLSPVVHPWYLGWLAALLVIRWSGAVYLLLALSAVSQVVVYRYQTSGVWADDPLLLLIEYLPVYAVLLAEIRRGAWMRTTGDRIVP
jgi:hypothetical protein